MLFLDTSHAAGDSRLVAAETVFVVSQLYRNCFICCGGQTDESRADFQTAERDNAGQSAGAGIQLRTRSTVRHQ